MTRPVNQTLSIYLPRDLAERVEQAKDAGTLEPKDVCKAALEAALSPKAPVDIVDLTQDFITGEPDTTAFQVQWAGSTVELQATLDNVTANGGFPQSIAIAPDYKYAVLIAWPQRPV